jgi:hypothetical protein
MDIEHDYITGKGHRSWGNAIYLINPQLPAHPDTLIAVDGCVPRRPRIGATLLIDGARNYTLTEFVEVTYSIDPPDAFTGRVRIVKQWRKGDGVLLYDRTQLRKENRE